MSVERPTWRDLFHEAAARLGSESEARRLVERASGNEGNEYYSGLGQPTSPRTEPFFRDLLERRASGEPLQYVLGQWGFRTLDLLVDRRVLIPRPETEVVVEVALEQLRVLGKNSTVVDLGTGSGAIALSIASEARGAHVWATDRSPDALAVAGANLAGLGTLAANRVRLVEGRWFEALPASLRGAIQLVVSNPPYIADDEDLPPDVRDWEPPGALFAGPTGLEDVEAIVAEAPSWLGRPGVLVLEVAPHQGESALGLVLAAGATGEVRKDLAGRDRVLVATWH